MDNSYPKDGHVKLPREFKVTVLSVNRFECASWYSMNGQNDEFQTVINCHKIFTAFVATGDKKTVHKESQPVLGIKIESYILATFLDQNDIFRGNCGKKLNNEKKKQNKDKR